VISGWVGAAMIGKGSAKESDQAVIRCLKQMYKTNVLILHFDF
jgi:hypothetical protein